MSPKLSSTEFRSGTTRFARSLLLIALLAALPVWAARVDVREHGAAGDGATDDTPAFLAALAAIGDAPGSLLVAGGTFSVANLELPQGVSLEFAAGGRLAPQAGSEISIHGAIVAGIEQIFTGEGRVSGRVANLHVYPQWFGSRGDGEHDDGPALQKAADLAARSMGRTLFIPAGTYVFRNDIHFRCNIECHGRLIKEIEIDESRTRVCPSLFLPTHHPRHNPHVIFSSDHPSLELDATAFHGIEEGDLQVQVFREVPLADGSGTVDLAEGGTLRFYSSDFFSSRSVRKGDHYYDRNDITQLVSGRGDVFPEFAFSYLAPPDADPWSAERVYGKGDYVSHQGEVFKAAWPSGPGTDYTHRHHGTVEIGPVEPNPAAATTAYRFQFPSGTRDSFNSWRRVRTQVWYREKDAPLTVNGLDVEVRLLGHEGEVKRIAAGAVQVQRSNMVFNRLRISVRDREATMNRLLSSSHCVNVEFNNGYFSGATSAHLGYNILNSNVANFRYNDCVSTNSRKGVDGRHAKNIRIQGGYYNIIEDHYGRNITVRDVVVSGLSVHVPGDSTPAADLQAWEFRPRRPFGLAGANMHIENCIIDQAAGGIFGARGDVGDLYGTIVMRNLVVRRNRGDVRLFTHSINPTFDYAHEVRVPDNVIIEDITLENPGKLVLNIGSGFAGGAYGPIQVRNSGPIGNVSSTSRSLTFTQCTIDNARFNLAPDSFVSFHNCVFVGSIVGVDPRNLKIARGNTAARGAQLGFPLDYVNEERFERGLGFFREARTIPLPDEGWKFRRDPERIGGEGAWHAAELDDAEWEDIGIGQAWQRFGHDYIGVAWYRASFDLPPREQWDLVELHFGGVDESAWVWINGRKVGSHDIGPSGWNVPFSLPADEQLVWGGSNQITVRAMNTAAMGGIWRPVTVRCLVRVPDDEATAHPEGVWRAIP